MYIVCFLLLWCWYSELHLSAMCFCKGNRKKPLKYGCLILEQMFYVGQAISAAVWMWISKEFEMMKWIGITELSAFFLVVLNGCILVLIFIISISALSSTQSHVSSKSSSPVTIETKRRSESPSSPPFKLSPQTSPRMRQPSPQASPIWTDPSRQEIPLNLSKPKSEPKDDYEMYHKKSEKVVTPPPAHNNHHRRPASSSASPPPETPPSFMGLGNPFGIPQYPFMMNPMTSSVFSSFTARPPLFNGKHFDKVNWSYYSYWNEKKIFFLFK